MFFRRQKGVLFLLCFLLSASTLAQYKVREIKCQEDKDLVFPVFLSTDKAVSKKINEVLQRDFFETTIYQIAEAKLFDESRFFYNDSNSQSGYTSISYKIELNDHKILSVKFEVESMGAYPTYYQRYFSFNARTGNVISPDSLFTPKGVNTLRRYLIEKRKEEIGRWINELQSDGGSGFKGDSSFIFETFKECNQNADEKNIFIEKGKILFYKEDCFPHAWMPLNTDLNVQVTNRELEKYFSPFGRKLLLTK